MPVLGSDGKQKRPRPAGLLFARGSPNVLLAPEYRLAFEAFLANSLQSTCRTGVECPPFALLQQDTTMALSVARFFLLFLLSLLVGTMFGILVGYNPAGLSALAYVEQQQNAIRSFNTLLPSMGALCIVLTVGLAFRLRSDRRVCYLHVVAAILMVVAALVTRFGNQPINAIVMTWSAPHQRQTGCSCVTTGGTGTSYAALRA